VSEQTTPECGHWDGTARQTCRTTDSVRLYATGHRCPRHAPAALAGSPEPQPGPGWPTHRKKVV
jgi:hypothetical protein